MTRRTKVLILACILVPKGFAGFAALMRQDWKLLAILAGGALVYDWIVNSIKTAKQNGSATGNLLPFFGSPRAARQ